MQNVQLAIPNLNRSFMSLKHKGFIEQGIQEEVARRGY
jgi:hypothetical protein